MSGHLAREINRVNKKVLSLSTMVEEAVELAVRAALERNAVMAEGVLKRDQEIDSAEVEIEEECLKLLALYQPVASDLRFIVAVLKMNNDLERIGDLAVNIASRAMTLANIRGQVPVFDLEDLGSKVKTMLRMSLQALVKADSTLARQVCSADKEVDELNRATFARTQEEIRKSPENVEALLLLLSVSRNLERIGDLATNIAEDVIYMIEGEIIRHRWSKNAGGTTGRA